MEYSVSTLKINNIQAATGNTISVTTGNKIMMPGSIVQTQFTRYATATTQSMTGYADTAIAGLNVNITPTAANSIIKIEASWFGEIVTTQEWDHQFFFFRDSTKIPSSSDLASFGDDPGSRTFGIARAVTSYYAGADDSTTPNYCAWSYFDLPNTTSQITYKAGFYCQTTNTLYTNRTITDTNQQASTERGMCFISATEIAQ